MDDIQEETENQPAYENDVEKDLEYGQEDGGIGDHVHLIHPSVLAISTKQHLFSPIIIVSRHIYSFDIQI